MAKRRISLYALLVRASPGRVVVVVVMTLAVALVPLLLAVESGILVQAVRTHANVTLPAIGFAAAVLATPIIAPFQSALRLRVRRDVDSSIRSEVRRIIGAHPDRLAVESPSFLQDVDRACDASSNWRARTPGAAALGQLALTTRIVASLTSAMFVAAFNVGLAVGVLTIAIVVRTMQRRAWLHGSIEDDRRAPKVAQRKAIEGLLVDERASKELRVFSMKDWLLGRRAELIDLELSDSREYDGHLAWRRAALGALVAVGGLLLLIVPVMSSLDGGLSQSRFLSIVLAGVGIMALGHIGAEAFDIEYGLEALDAFQRIRASQYKLERAAPQRDKAEDPSPGARVSVSKVSFSYSRRPVISNMDLDIEGGQIAAIVGRNGAGKTTLIKLLSGLYVPHSGTILVDGKPPRREDFAIVSQDFLRFPGTVAENLLLGASESRADPTAMRRALDRVNMWDEVCRMPDGLETQLWTRRGRYESLSGGQWQRLVLARAIYALDKGRRVAILDEPTAQLDVEAEYSFYDQVIEAIPDRTVILISHRLSTVKKANQIHFMAGGRVVESGSHEELMSIDGEYANLFKLQAARFADRGVL